MRSWWWCDCTEICRSCFNVNFIIVFKTIHLCISLWIKKTLVTTTRSFPNFVNFGFTGQVNSSHVCTYDKKGAVYVVEKWKIISHVLRYLRNHQWIGGRYWHIVVTRGLRDFWLELYQYHNIALQEINNAVLMLVCTTERTALDSVYVAVFWKL
jgi:hypothetical protein